MQQVKLLLKMAKVDGTFCWSFSYSPVAPASCLCACWEAAANDSSTYVPATPGGTHMEFQVLHVSLVQPWLLQASCRMNLQPEDIPLQSHFNYIKSFKGDVQGIKSRKPTVRNFLKEDHRFKNCFDIY